MQHLQLAGAATTTVERPRHQRSVRGNDRGLAQQAPEADAKQAGRTPQPRHMQQIGRAQLGRHMPQQTRRQIFPKPDRRIERLDPKLRHPATRQLGQPRRSAGATRSAGQHPYVEPGGHLGKAQLIQRAHRASVAMRRIKRRHDVQHAQWRQPRRVRITVTRHRGPIPWRKARRKFVTLGVQKWKSSSQNVIVFVSQISLN